MRAATTGTIRFVSLCNVYHLIYRHRVAINMLLIANGILIMTSYLQFAVNMLLNVVNVLKYLQCAQQ